ncbi:unnamed protein product [Brassica oleracea var. botrytis]
MSASKFAIFCIVLICLASLHECMSYIAYIPSNPLESLPMFVVAVPLHTGEASKRIVRRFVYGSIWGH